MKPATKKTGAATVAFVPTIGEAPRHGRRRVLARAPSVSLRWPATTKARKELFDAWHQIGMQTVHSAGVNFRLMALIERFVNWQSGELWPSNETLARRAGGCGESTVKRDIATYQKLGLLTVELGWRRLRNGRIVRKRTIRLAIPEAFRGQIEEAFEGLTCGPDGEPDHQAHSGAEHGLTRGPITLEDTPDSAVEDSHAV